MKLMLLLVLLVLLLVLVSSIDDKTCSSSSGNSVCNDAIPASKVIVGSSKPYPLVASAMRRKNLLVVNVDVYHVGIYLSSGMEAIVKSNIKSNKGFGLATKTGEEVSISIYLKFVRSVTTDKIVQAFKEGLTISDKSAVDTFTSVLLKKIGQQGASKDDTIEFIFKGKNNEEIGILVRNDKVPEVVKSVALREQLIEIYTGKNSIVPDIPKQLMTKYT
jgi:hypothetical protein